MKIGFHHEFGLISGIGFGAKQTPMKCCDAPGDRARRLRQSLAVGNGDGLDPAQGRSKKSLVRVAEGVRMQGDLRARNLVVAAYLQN
jgi:hypothetical protein